MLRKNKYNCFIRIDNLPDSTSKTMICPNGHQFTDFATFLDDGNVLLRCKHRYLMFNKNGKFLQEVLHDNSCLHKSNGNGQENRSTEASSQKKQKKHKREGGADALKLVQM